MQRSKVQLSSDVRQKKNRKNKRDYGLRYIDPNGLPSDEPYNSAWAVETKAFMTSQNLKALFFSEDWVFITVDAFAQPISLLPIQVVRKTIENGQMVEKTVDFHQVSSLLESPNKWSDGTELKYSLACDYVLGGNAFVYHAKSSKEIYHISFDRVQYDFDQQHLPKSYIVYPDSDEIIVGLSKGMQISLDDMAHIRRPNPSSPIWGMSPFIAGRRSILFNRYSQDYLNSFYLKGATPQGILEMDQAANEQSVLRLLRSFEMAHTGRRNQRRTMLLPKGVKWTPADHKIADQGIVDLVRMNRETILNTLHIPKHVVSLQEAGSLGSQEHKMSLKYFWQTALIPTANAIASSLTKHFRKCGMLSDAETLQFDLSSVSFLQDDLMAQAEMAAVLLKTHTLNEVRSQVFGLAPLDGGDLTPGAAQPLPFKPLQLSEVKELQPSATIEPQPKPEPVQTKEVGRYQAQVKANYESVSSHLKTELPKMYKWSLDLFADQANAAVKTLKVKKGLKANLPTVSEYRKRLKKALSELEDQYTTKYNEILSSSMDIGYENQLKLIFDKTARETLEVAKATDANGRAQTLSARGIDTFDNVSKTSTDKIMKIVKKGIEENMSVDDVAKMIADDFGDQTSRANLIARTEMLTAVSIGSASMMNLAAKAIPDLQKAWVTAQDDRVRESHRAVNGEIRKHDEEFSNGLMYPSDPNGEPSETIACRCVLVTLAPEDMAEYEQELQTLAEEAP